MIGIFKLCQVFEWTGEDGVTYKFDVDTALEVITKEKPEKMTLPLELIKQAIELNYGPEINEAAVQRANLNNPVIIITMENDHHVVMDGWHRLFKAAREGKDLFAYMLTKEQTRKVKIN